MASAASDGFGRSPTENRRLRNCASVNQFSARPRIFPTPPLLSGETEVCEDVFETQIENMVGETQVLVGEGEVCDRDCVQLANLEDGTQVVEHLDDEFEMCGVNVGGETQVWDDYGRGTQVDDAEYYHEMPINLGGDTEVQDDEDCVRNICPQFLRNGIDSSAGGGSNESGVVKDVFCDIKSNLVDEKLGHSYGKRVERENETSSSTPPSIVEVDPRSFQRSFTSIRAASLRASGLAARCKALVETRNNSFHTLVEKENEIAAHSPGSIRYHDIAEQEVKDDASMCEAVCSVAKKLFNEVPAENRNSSIECDCEGAKTPPLTLPDNDDEVAGLSYIDSQEPGDSTQADALDFIEWFVKDNASAMQLEADNKPLKRTVSKPASCAKGFLNFPKKTTILRQMGDQAVSFDWDEELEDEGGGEFFCRLKEKILKESSHKQKSLPQPQKSRKCVKLFGDQSGKMKFHDKSTAIQSDSKLLLFNSYRKGKILDTVEANMRRNLETELNEEFVARCAEEPTEAATCRSGIQEMFSVGPDTQIAAEAMEALFSGVPIFDSDVDANQGNHASVTTVAESKSTQTAKILELKKKSPSDDLVIRKSKRKLNEKKGLIHGTTRKRKGEDEVNETHTTENKRPANDKVSPSMIARRATRSMVLNKGIMLLNQDDVAVSKDKNCKTNFQVGVAIPKGRRSRKEISDKSTKDGYPVVLNLSCNEGSAAKRSVASSTRAFCSLDAANINWDVSHQDVPDHHSSKGTGSDTADCGMPVEVVGTVPRTDKPTRRSCKPPDPSCSTSDNHSKIHESRLGNSCRRQLPIHLSRSSLRKEISALLSNSPKSLSDLKRKRREMNEVRILFSNHLDDDMIKHQKKILARLGASLAFSISDATHFVADSFVRTRNMLEAIALGKQIVTHLWLESCNQTSCLIDEKAYILRDVKKERELGFSMPDTLVRARQQPLLQHRIVIITPNSKPSKDIVATLVKAIHGRVVKIFDISSLKVDKNPDNVLILSCDEDYLFCQPFLNEGVKAYSSELLLSGIVTQRLDYARHRLFEDHVRTEVSRRSRSTRGCRSPTF